MGNHSSDRQRMRNDLRELAKLAATPAPAAAHAFDDADSSGYVDLSAFSARDPRWVDRELARAKTGAPPPPPPRRPATAAVPTPRSVAPVALEALLEPDDTAATRPSRTRGFLYGIAALAAVGLVGFLAVTVARHPPPAAAAAAPPAAAPIVAAATASAEAADVTPATAPSPAQPATTAAVTPPAQPAAPPSSAPPVTASAPPSKSAKSHHRAPRATIHPAAASAPVHVAAATRPASVPPSSAGGGNSLMDLIKQSVAKGK